MKRLFLNLFLVIICEVSSSEFKEVTITCLFFKQEPNCPSYSESRNIYINSTFCNNNVLSPYSHKKVLSGKDLSLIFQQYSENFIFLFCKLNTFIIYYQSFTYYIQIDPIKLKNGLIIDLIGIRSFQNSFYSCN